VTRWTAILLVVSAAVVTLAHWFVGPSLQAVLSVLLFALVVLTVVAEHSAVEMTLRSLKIAHYEQIESERRYRALFDACSDVILAFPIEENGRAGSFVEVNEAACRTLSYPREVLLSLAPEKICAPEFRDDLRGRSEGVRLRGSDVFETVLLTRKGHLLPVEVSARMVVIRGEALCLAVARDVAVRKEREERLEGISIRDELTGLLNRRGFFAMVDDVVRRVERWDGHVLLAYVDVDGLKRVNDCLGHAAGDEVLVAAADVLRHTFREGDVVARMGGDEFVAMAVLEHPGDEQLDRDTIMSRLESATATKRAELDEAYQFSLSCGVAIVAGRELGEIDDLLARTDKRMYEAKRGRSAAAR
jgi:diguanylate cyclase (GGDEF)-like protein/PAS domain S-box-containing protein